MRNINTKKIYLLATIFLITFIGFFVSISYVKWYGAIMIYLAFISLLIMLVSAWYLDKLKENKKVGKFENILNYFKSNQK